MLGIRQLLFTVLIVVAFWLLRRAWRNVLQTQARTPPASKRAQRYLETVRCVYCGVHVPRNQAIGDDRQGFFCGETHRLAHRKTSTQDQS